MRKLLVVVGIALASLTGTFASGSPIIVTTVPSSVTSVNAGSKQQFSATGGAVYWIVSGSACSGGCGSITVIGGLYTAPVSVASPLVVTVTAFSIIDPTSTGSTTIKVNPSASNGSVTVTPPAVTLSASGQQKFSAQVSGSSNNAVTWALGLGCAPCGSITQGGVYTAPASIAAASNVTIIATSTAPPNLPGSAVVSLQPPVSINIAPPSAIVSPLGQQLFTATVTNAANTGVQWSVSCSGGPCGSISSGNYTAPSAPPTSGVVTVTARSLADFSRYSSATVTFAGTTKVSVSPSGGSPMNAGTSQQFSSTVVGPANKNVTWSVGGNGCFGNCGTITPTGWYTAPVTLPRTLLATITATSQANTSASASVSVLLIPVVGITLAPFNSQMTAGTPQQLSATVTGTPNQTVQWSLSSSACSGTSCGTISPSGLYTAPAGVLSPLNVTVKVTAQADSSKSALAPITVVPPVVISVSPSALSMSVNSQQQFIVAITGTPNTAVTWGVSGAGCSGVTCGMVSPISANTALYQAPAGIPTPANVSITAKLVSDTTKSGSAVTTIVPVNNLLPGQQFAFLFRGFDPSGTYQAAGSFTVDGNGGLSGVEDINCGAGKTGDPICNSGTSSQGFTGGASSTFTGTYTINADGRGTFTITPSSGPPQTFALAMSPTNMKARFIEESDTSGIRGSGVIELQNPSAFVPTALAYKRYSFNLSGIDSSGSPIAAIGAMGLTVPTAGPVTEPVIDGGVMDVNDNGQTSCYPPVRSAPVCDSKGPLFQQFSGTYTVGSNGRGTASFTVQGFDGNPLDLNSLNFSLYVVSSTEFFLLSMDDPGITTNPVPVFSGDALAQRLPVNANPFQQGNAVFSWSGLTPGLTPGTGIPQAAVGQVSLDGSGGVTNIYFDINNGGVTTVGEGLRVCDGQSLGSCTYATQPSYDILLSAGDTTLRIFPTSLNSGFILGAGPSVQVGKIESQQASAFPLPFMFGSDLMLAPNASLISGAGTLTYGSSGANGPVTGNEDVSPPLPSLFMPNLPLDSRYGPTSLPNGNTYMYSNSTRRTTLDLWVVTPSKMVAIDVEPGTVPSLIIFEH